MKQVDISHTISPLLKHHLPFSKKLMKETTKEKGPGNFQPEEKNEPCLTQASNSSFA